YKIRVPVVISMAFWQKDFRTNSIADRTSLLFMETQMKITMTRVAVANSRLLKISKCPPEPKNGITPH
ncbi:hypothetical protein, partial [Vibrio parahaemolyticus]|uniref:hypothetical protein n=1 Tax=Vibrio parahaemolyticus TaxID=670 RepID=UPI001C5E1FA1